MTIAFDNSSATSAAGTGTLRWTHTPVGTPKGVLVFVVHNGSGADEVTGVTYGGVAVPEIVKSPNLHATGEPGAMHAFFKGYSVPTGAHQVVVSVSGTASKRAAAYTVTATSDSTVLTSSSSISIASIANPSVTLSAGSFSHFTAIGYHSGSNATSNNTQFTNWINTLEADFGTTTGGWYRHGLISKQNNAAGWTQAANDAVMIAVALRDLADVPPITSSAKMEANFYRRSW